MSSGNKAVFREPAGAKPRSGPGAGAKGAEAAEKYETAKGKLEKDIERLLKLIDQTVNNYNESLKKASNYEQIKDINTIDVDSKNLPALKKKVQEIMGRMEDHFGEEDVQDNKYYLLLVEIDGNIRQVEAKQAEISTIEVNSFGEHKRRLHENFTAAVEAREKKKGWESQQVYQDMLAEFEGLLGDKEFADLWHAPEGVSTSRQREAQELFFAIMAEKTNGFESSFVLGEGFTNDYNENIKRFPFVYNEWLKLKGATVMGKHVSLESMAAARNAAIDKRDVIGMSLDDISNSLRSIIGANQGGGVDVAVLDNLPRLPKDEAWAERAETIKGFIHILSQAARSNPDWAQAPGWKRAAEELTKYQAHAEAEAFYYQLRERKESIDKSFTRDELSKSGNRINVMKIVMRKFKKAMDMVDQQVPGAKSDLLHPAVRRMLIASVYDSGVADFRRDEKGRVEYTENLRADHDLMNSSLILSKYFNKLRVNEFISPSSPEGALLKAAYLSSKITVFLQHSKDTEKLLVDWKHVLEENPNISDPEDRKVLFETMVSHSPEEVKKFAGYSLAETDETLRILREDQKLMKEFVERSLGAIDNPDSPEARKFIDDILANRYAGELSPVVGRLGKLGIIEAKELEAYMDQVYEVQNNFLIAESQDKDELQFFETLGINIEPVYMAYLNAINENPEFNISNWDDLLLSEDPAEFNKLITILDRVIPPSEGGGKEDFLIGMKSLRAKGPFSIKRLLDNPETAGEDAAVINVYLLLKAHLRHRERVAGESELKQKEIEAKRRGLHIGDYVSEYVGGVWEMLTGPGQSWANRAAGLILLYGGYKLARKAMKGEGNTGKMMRMLFVAGAAEIALKEITGRGVLDRANVDALAGAMEGTYEGVLLQDGEKMREEHEITPEEHANALQELKAVPFYQVVDWYESSDDGGNPRKAADGSPLADKLPKQIRLNKIVTRKDQAATLDKKKRARFVLKKTAQHFFTYVGHKRHEGAEDTLDALKERWVYPLDPKKADAQRKKTAFWVEELTKRYGGNRDTLTWAEVVVAEIGPGAVDLTKGKTPIAQVLEAGEEAYEVTEEWFDNYVANPGKEAARDFFASVGEGVQSTKASIERLSEFVGDKIYFGKKSLEFWYEGHKYEIYHVAKNHWNLLVTGVTLPFKAVYAVDQWAIPWTLSKLDQVEVILKANKTETIDHNLALEDIGPANPVDVNSSNLKRNPSYSYFGNYQIEFMDAFSEGGFHQSAENVGYYISEMDPSQVGVDINQLIAAGKTSEVHNQLYAASRKQAEQFFRDKELDWDDIKEFMYPIHTIVKNTEPPKMYVFWRMPLKGSAELYLKQTGQWADYYDPKKHRERDPFVYDGSETTLENLSRAFALGTGPLRVLVSKAGAYAAQLPRFALWNAEKAGAIIAWFFPDRETKDRIRELTTVSPAREQLLDEFSTAAGNYNLAASDFYKEKDNADLYKVSLQYAQKRGKPLHLGVFEGEDGYDSTFYLDGTIDFADLFKFYMEDYAPSNKRLDQAAENRLIDKAADYMGRPANGFRALLDQAVPR